MRWPFLIPSCLAAVLAFATAGQADAAFIAPAFDGDGVGDGLGFDEGGSGMSEPFADRRTDEDTPVPGPRLYSRTGRGMSTPSTSVPTTTGAAGGALLVVSPLITGGRLETFWWREGRCELPMPRLVGVFRPPRHC